MEWRAAEGEQDCAKHLSAASEDLPVPLLSLQVTRTRKEKPVTQPEQSPGETENLRSQDLAMVLCKPQPSGR